MNMITSNCISEARELMFNGTMVEFARYQQNYHDRTVKYQITISDQQSMLEYITEDANIYEKLWNFVIDKAETTEDLLYRGFKYVY